MDEVTKRIGLVINHFRLTKTEFADRLELNRSVVSHLFNGRNNPSLPLIKKLLEEFKDVNPTWLLHGEGVMLLPGPETPSPTPSIPESVGGKDIERVVVFYKDGTFREYTPGTS